MFQLAIEIVSSARTEDADARKAPTAMATTSGADTSRNKRAHRMFHLMNMKGPIDGSRPTRPHPPGAEPSPAGALREFLDGLRHERRREEVQDEFILSLARSPAMDFDRRQGHRNKQRP